MTGTPVIQKLPIIFCASFPTCVDVPLELPFGLPTVTFRDPCCQGLDITLNQLKGLLLPLQPILQMLGCALKVINLVKAIPDALGPPPDPTKIASLVQMVAGVAACADLILSFTPIGAIIPFCKLVRDLAFIMMSLLKCIRRQLVIVINIGLDVLFLLNTNDPDLRRMGLCLGTQNNATFKALIDKMNALLQPLALVNTLIGLVLPLKQGLQQVHLYPLAPYQTLGSIVPSDMLNTIDDTIAILQVLATVANLCAGP